jgi:HSP20 family protein
MREELSRLVEVAPGFDVPAGVFPLLNVSQDNENIYVRSEIPGMKREDIEVSTTGRSLTVSGERKIAEESEKAKWHRKERESGRFRRQVNLPTEVNAEKVQAQYRLGILMIVLPKAESAKPKQISISS